MRKYSVSLYIGTNGKKIAAIKDIRQALGLGLIEAKNLVEANDYQHIDLILNGDQIAGLVEISRTTSCGLYDQPDINIVSCKVLPVTPTQLDFSNITRQ